MAIAIISTSCFNTQPPEGGWLLKPYDDVANLVVSTHSRLKAAGMESRHKYHLLTTVSTHSRLKAAGI